MLSSSGSSSFKYVQSNHHVRLFSFLLTSNLLLTLILEALLIGVSVAESVKSVDPKAYEDNEFAEFEDTDDDQNININDPRSGVSGQNRGGKLCGSFFFLQFWIYYFSPHSDVDFC